MIKIEIPFYLASRSPRRKKLLAQIGLYPIVKKIKYHEDLTQYKIPSFLVKKLSFQKMETAQREIPYGLILTADTIVFLKGKIIGKPKNEKDAFKILSRLSGKTHSVFTGFTLYNSVNLRYLTSFAKTSVRFRKLESDEIWEYIKSGSPMDKAGAYGIQDDYGAVFVERISGCYYNVMGLPITKVFNGIKEVL